MSSLFREPEESHDGGANTRNCRRTRPFEIEMDASHYVLVGILLKDGQPIVYVSRKLNDAERRHAVSEKEMLTVVVRLGDSISLESNL